MEAINNQDFATSDFWRLSDEEEQSLINMKIREETIIIAALTLHLGKIPTLEDFKECRLGWFPGMQERRLSYRNNILGTLVNRPDGSPYGITVEFMPHQEEA